jgi:YVTN family beta-propeller protein
MRTPANKALSALGFSLLVAAAVQAPALAQTAAASGSHWAFATNEGDGTVSVIDTNSDTVVKTLQLGGKPRGLTLCKGSELLFVTEQTKPQLWAINPQKTGTQAIEHRVPLGESPEAVYCSPDGLWLGVANEGSNSISFIDTRQLLSGPEKGQVAFSIVSAGKNPEHGVFSPDGHNMLVSAEEADQVDWLDLDTRRQVGAIKVGERPRGIAFSPDGKTAYVAVESASRLVAIDTASQKVLATQTVGKRTAGVLVSPDGQWVYASNGGDGTVSVIDAASFSVVATIAVGQRPWNMGFSHDGQKLYVATGRSAGVSVIDLKTRTLVQQISTGKLTWGVVAQ